VTVRCKLPSALREAGEGDDDEGEALVGMVAPPAVAAAAGLP
jgi:hypothetical protein